MRRLARNFRLVAMATLAAGGLCAGVGFLISGQSGLLAALVAMTISFTVGTAVLALFYRYGVSPQVIVLGMMVRVGSSLGAAGIAAAAFSELRTPLFFLTVVVTYLVNLAVETWLVYCEDRRSGVTSASA